MNKKFSLGDAVVLKGSEHNKNPSNRAPVMTVVQTHIRVQDRDQGGTKPSYNYVIASWFLDGKVMSEDFHNESLNHYKENV